MKNLLLAVICGLFLSNALQAQDKKFDFSAVCSSGQTLYYRILDDQAKNQLQMQNTPNAVSVTYPILISTKGGWNRWEGYAKPKGDVIIPSNVINNGITYTVVEIGYCAFEECDDLESVIIPNTVVSIALFSFENCSKLKSVVIPDSVKEIRAHAFRYCKALKSITIPNSVHKIDYYVFEYSGLKFIKFPDSMKEIHPCEGNQCSHCEELESVILPADLQVIPAGMFSYCYSLKDISIPNSVKKIEDVAFLDCHSLSVKVPNTVTYVGNNGGADFNRAFENCLNVVYHGKLKGAPWGAQGHNAYVEGNLVYKDKTKKVVVGCNRGKDVTSVVIPNSVIEIGKNAFRYMSQLKSIIVGTSVKKIGDGAFFRGEWGWENTKIAFLSKTPPVFGKHVLWRMQKER